MTLRPAPGMQISSGRLRVDAAKAIAKLREYQLVDRTAWILEGVRAAVAAGATSIDLQGDSNDVWLSWTGTPWPADDLPRLFDELVSPEPGASRHHVRLLAAAVNSALGANPAYVDVYSIADDGAVRVRYTPDVLEAPTGELEESPLRKVQAQVAGIPHGASKGMHIHFRRRASLEVVSYWLRRADPPELVMARSACGDIATPIRIGDAMFDRAASHRDVVRIPLGDDIEGWLAVTNTMLVPPHEDDIELAIAERGVLLETTTIDLGLSPTAPIPLRVFIDAPRLPTNASRSEVRRDTHPVSTGERRAKELVPALIAKLVERCRVAQVDPRARHAAIHLVASVIAGADWAHRAREIQPPLRALAELPLVRDAAGMPRPIAHLWSGLVHLGSEPLPQDLAPWLSHVLWAPPDDPTTAFVTSWVDRRALKDHVKLAKRERRAEKTFYKHAPREPRVLGRRKHRVRARLGAPLAGSAIPDDAFTGLAGEICVYRDKRGGELIVLLGGREIETVEFDSALSFTAVIDSQDVKPTDRFRGVQRDAAYAHVERAMRAGVVRALEAVALAQAKTFVDGYQIAADGIDDASLIRNGLLLSRNLGVPLSPAFAGAATWRTTEGLHSIDDLRTHAVIGVVPTHTTVPPLDGRIVVYADDTDRALLVDLVPSRFIPYEPGTLAERITTAELAVEIMGSEPHALAIEDAGLIAAIVPTEKPRLLLHHRGRQLAEWPYTPTLAACTIAVDWDRIVPADDWNGIVDDAGLGTRDYAPWERLLAREIVRAILGERSPDLLGGANIEVGGTLGRWLCFSFGLADPEEILGVELLRRFELASVFRVLGEPRAHSIAELAVMFPDTINFVEHATEPVAGFPVLVAESIVARMVARLAKRKFRNVMEDLAKRRMQLARELRLGMHRAQPTRPLEVAGTHVSIHNTLGKGVVGVGRDMFELHVLVEGRLFQTITRTNELPMTAVFELADASRTDPKFERLELGVDELIVASVRAKCAELLRAIAEQFPEALADAGPRRSLLAAFLARHQPTTDLRETLARSIQFPTVQGLRATLLAARSGPAIQICTWVGEWIVADRDDHALDKPVLLTAGSPEPTAILSALGNIVDITPEIARLQTQRRIARGLLPTPKVTNADPELTKRLADLGTTYHHLGPGEVALVGGESELLIHVHGELRERVTLDCLPSIQLAIEAADLVGDRTGAIERRIGPEARALAKLVVERVLLERSPETLPHDIRRNLRRAIIAGQLDLRTAPVFETLAGPWIDLAAVQVQRELFGKLWAVATPPPHTTPLDERRIVLVLAAGEQELANDHGIPVVEATNELALDARTRINRDRPAAESLALEAFHGGIIGTLEIAGDGISSPRGMVAVLAPNAAHHRQLRLHRAMHPFDPATDPCRWPTIATLDDARFTPDRCWEHPERDDIYKAAIDALHRASNDALRAVAPAPANALASIRVAPWTYDSVTLLRAGDLQIRGTLWIDGPPIPAISPAIRVVQRDGESSFVPLRGLGLAGTLFVHSTKANWEREAVLETLSKAMHAKLVREMALARRRSPDLVGAHVAWALALERITPADAKHIQFECFRPAPLDATALAALLAASTPVGFVTPDSPYTDHCLVDDGSETARIIKNWIGSRLRAPSSSTPARKRPETLEPPPTPVVDHPLQPFVNRLHTRMIALGVQVAVWRLVDDREEPLAHYDDDTLELAASNRHIIETAAACLANTAWSGDALDAIAAHCITVLNIALAAITDATEARAIGKLLG